LQVEDIGVLAGFARDILLRIRRSVVYFHWVRYNPLETGNASMPKKKYKSLRSFTAKSTLSLVMIKFTAVVLDPVTIMSSI
jgi:hypothetical protein